MGCPIVLCIDDRPEQLEIRKAVLEARGFRVEAVTSGFAAMNVGEKPGGCGSLGVQRGR
jgi:CheY-like chemotaxis protein